MIFCSSDVTVQVDQIIFERFLWPSYHERTLGNWENSQGISDHLHFAYSSLDHLPQMDTSQSASGVLCVYTLLAIGMNTQTPPAGGSTHMEHTPISPKMHSHKDNSVGNNRWKNLDETYASTPLLCNAQEWGNTPLSFLLYFYRGTIYDFTKITPGSVYLLISLQF